MRIVLEEHLRLPAALGEGRKIGRTQLSGQVAEFARVHIVCAALDFGAQQLNVAVVRTITIWNNGCHTDLRVTSVLVVENDTLTEFSVPQPNAFMATLAPGESVDVPVTLLAQDAELDVANLEIMSNDPDEPVLRVLLTSSP